MAATCYAHAHTQWQQKDCLFTSRSFYSVQRNRPPPEAATSGLTVPGRPRFMFMSLHMWWTQTSPDNLLSCRLLPVCFGLSRWQQSQVPDRSPRLFVEGTKRWLQKKKCQRGDDKRVSVAVCLPAVCVCCSRLHFLPLLTERDWRLLDPAE